MAFSDNPYASATDGDREGIAHTPDCGSLISSSSREEHISRLGRRDDSVEGNTTHSPLACDLNLDDEEEFDDGGESDNMPSVGKVEDEDGASAGGKERSDATAGEKGEDEDGESSENDMDALVLEKSRSSQRKKRAVKRGGEKRVRITREEFPSTMTTQASLDELFVKPFFKNITFEIPTPEQRPWTVNQLGEGYFCLYECFFSHYALWFPLPKLLTDYCNYHGLAVSQLSHACIRSIVGVLTIANEIKIEVDREFLD